ncbi:hypothetical protein FACS189440_21020 [Bacteroidia bacterium]|nr:hypothetical protein FACS189440_21020 [Bacteroidia bacterium]
MNNQDLDNIRVSLSTDAIIYLPFYLAYFGGDFEDTPYGRVNVQIVGLNDIRFKYYDEELEEKTPDTDKPQFQCPLIEESKKEESNIETGEKPSSENSTKQKQKCARLRGDAFMALDVLYGIADVGLGDVGFVSVLRNEKKRNELFTNTDSKGHNLITKYSEWLNPDMSNPDLDIFKIPTSEHKTKLSEKVSNSGLRIVGGLIRKPALKCLLKDKAQAPEKGDKNFIRNKDRLKALTNNLEIFSYPKPTTAYYYINKIINEYAGDSSIKDKVKWKDQAVDFGNELTQKNITNTTGCFSCDFVALRYANKNTTDYKDYALVDDWTCMDTNILWSGFILDEIKYKEKENAFNAFFYVIDKCLFKINQFLALNDSHGLHYYIKTKLTNNRSKLNDVFRVLIADEKITEIIRKNEEIKPNNMDINLDQIIRYFIKDLFYCKKSNLDANFYYQSLNIHKPKANNQQINHCKVQKSHILELVKLREETMSEKDLDNHIKYDVMENWHKREKRINKIKHYSFTRFFYNIFKKDYVRSLSVIIALIGIIFLVEPFFSHKQWEILTNVHAGWSLLLFVAIAIGLWLFIEKIVMPMIDILQKEKYVINPKRGIKPKNEKNEK